MSTYDPRRSRPTPKVAPDEESAPIEALLGPAPETSDPAPADAAPAALAASDPAPAASPAAPAAAPIRRVERAPSALLQLAPLLGVTLVVLVVWLIRRSRR